MKKKCPVADLNMSQETHDKIVSDIKKHVKKTADGYNPDDAVAMFCAKYLTEYAWKKNGEEGYVAYVSGISGIPEFAVLCEPKAYYALRTKETDIPFGFKL